MSNPKGTRFATSLLPLLREYYPDADRASLHGAKDTGDFLLPGERRFILEAKNRRAMTLAEWVDEADAEAYNAWEVWYKGKLLKPSEPPIGVVVHKRKGTQNPVEQYVTMTLGGFLRLVGR